ncbi:MAG: HesA/MoeB/ThiF family protein [Alphaproteobacteria bacterium]|nr:HesA/MoeB/ThiF family protein [Alphaproteobacteria bacterium]
MTMNINARYARQTVLAELGEEGQKKLLTSSVLCIGAGGLGSPALQYLAAAGIGRIGLVDDDTVDVSNLQRQVLFREEDQGKPKASAAAAALSRLNSSCHVEPYHERFQASNAERLVRNYDVILDGTDNFASKFLINDACMKYGKPLVYGSILGFEAQVSVFWAKHGPCYRCLYPRPPGGHVPNCAEAGVIGAMAGIAGSVQALEAVKMALGLAWCKEKQLEPLLGRLWMLDARTMQSRRLDVPKRPACAICSARPEKIALEDAGAACTSKSGVRPVQADEAVRMVGKACFIDVRETPELASGKVPEALHIPLWTLLNDEGALGDISPKTPVIVYCQHGIRSLTAASHLLALGFTNVSHIAGGIVRWPAKLI